MCSLLGYVIIYVILLAPQPDWAVRCAAGMVESPKNPVRDPAISPGPLQGAAGPAGGTHTVYCMDMFLTKGPHPD